MKKTLWILVLLLASISLASCQSSQYKVLSATEITARNAERSNEVKSYEEAARNGDLNAQFILGVMYKDGTGSDNDAIYSLKWLRESEDEGHLFANLARHPSLQFHEETFLANESIHYEEAINWLQKASTAGDPHAQFIYGLILYNGVKTPADKKKAVALFQSAAKQHVNMAEYYIGMMYETGNNLSKNAKRALEWLEKASQDNSMDAKFILGLKYFNGIGVPKDESKAKEYFMESGKYHAYSSFPAYIYYSIENEEEGSWTDKFMMTCSFVYDTTDVDIATEGGCGGRDIKPLPWNDDDDYDVDDSDDDDYGDVDDSDVDDSDVDDSDDEVEENNIKKAENNIDRDSNEIAKNNPKKEDEEIAEYQRILSNSLPYAIDYPQAFDYLFNTALNGSATSQYALAMLYASTGCKVQQNYNMVIDWLVKAASQGFEIDKTYQNVTDIYMDPESFFYDYSTSELSNSKMKIPDLYQATAWIDKIIEAYDNDQFKNKDFPIKWYLRRATYIYCNDIDILDWIYDFEDDEDLSEEQKAAIRKRILPKDEKKALEYFKRYPKKERQPVSEFTCDDVWGLFD